MPRRPFHEDLALFGDCAAWSVAEAGELGYRPLRILTDAFEHHVSRHRARPKLPVPRDLVATIERMLRGWSWESHGRWE